MTLAGVTPVVVGHSWGDSGEAAADWLVANHVPERRVVPFQNAAPVFVKPLLRVAVIVLLLSLSRMAHADAVGDLEKGYSAYAARKFSEAETRLRALLAPGSELKDPDKVADARMYLGAVLVAEGRTEEASTVFETLLREKPDYDPDKLRVQLEAIDSFIDVKTRLRAELEKIQQEEAQRKQAERAREELERQKTPLRLAMLEKLASEEHVVERNSRWLALVPFGVGQFQNGQDGLGWVFLSSETLLAVGSVVGAAVSIYESGQESDAWILSQVATARAYRTSAYNAAIGGDVLAGGFFLTAIIGALQAELTFVPEIVHVRRRELPRLSLSLSGLGISGEF
jgi:tetratricopeptide (TPR) repeat protein